MKKHLLFVCIGFLFYVKLFSQQMAVHNLYHYNVSLINPAATGCSECKNFTLTDRHQWSTIENAPSLQTLSIQIPQRFNDYKKHGFGLNVVRDINGAVQNLGGEFTYAYHINLKSVMPQSLSFGLSAKFGQYNFNEEDFNREIYDPIITYGNNAEWYYNFATGIFFRSETYYAGIGVYNLYPKTTELYRGYGNNSFFTTFILGYTIVPKRYTFKLRPSVYIAKDKDNLQIDLNHKIVFENGISSGICLRKYLGAYYRPGQNILLFLGYEFSSYTISYTYDLGINQLQLHHYGSHQLSLSYAICRKKYACPTY